MIRKLQRTEGDKAADIWLETNRKAHDFIPARYWEKHLKAVREMILQAEVYVCLDEKQEEIQGFIGLNGNHVEGLFVQSEAQSRGIGKQLLDFAKSLKGSLSLNVYQKNLRAVKFYQRENFKIQRESTDENTGEKEFFMIWKRL